MARVPELSVNSDPPYINANDGRVEDSIAEQNSQTVQCTICSKKFYDLKESLRHELLQHGSNKTKRPQKGLRNKLKSIVDNMEINTENSLHHQLLDDLHECEPGRELSIILKHHRMNDENLRLVYERIHNCLQKEIQSLRQLKIHPFGSFVSGLALRDSDIDLFIQCEQRIGDRVTDLQYIMFNRINNILHRSKCFSEVIPIRQARVPIIKCKHTSTGFSLDINLSCPSSVQNTNFLRDLLKLDTRIMELTVFLKVWAKQLQLIGRGNMSSYCFITLIIFYLQQPQSGRPAVLPSIKKLQENIPAVMIGGVNYAFELHESALSLPVELTTSNLIHGFFKFYSNFQFERVLLVPYLGEAIPKDQFKNDPACHDRLRAIGILKDNPAVQANRCVCVQDPFSLNHNIGKSVVATHLEYFRECIRHAYFICEDKSISTDAQLYEELLYGIIGRIGQASNINITATNKNPNKKTPVIGGVNLFNVPLPTELNCHFIPSRADLRAIAALFQNVDEKSLHELWIKYYLEAMTEIITDIYCLDLQSEPPIHSNKHQRLEQTDRTYTWLLSGSVDQWTGRSHQRLHDKTFMEFQLDQTKQFAATRRQNSMFAVQINATLTMNIYKPSAIEFIVTPRLSYGVGITKKNPLYKFFTTFKCGMQSFCLKEWLQMKDTKNVNCGKVD
ncbi:speckle targeted PIP5K1A-regulated poly(A) polymerase [Anastrepha obliqua]|uniref:speckle targeted PIP5K1A-regulated poly(A) polymerase n=1 Tax=Anastrepha obliqua TaxID=95512 RepID=UPI00240A4D4A|nr:speckle targeted PIP5K1A-regulated poly(A) polymerase [Anastrepha obliqua]XP_054733721.1 speckle targeted PIP5K1A-regulated poly(A) polymerase [Anastrepha obliqua]